MCVVHMYVCEAVSIYVCEFVYLPWSLVCVCVIVQVA